MKEEMSHAMLIYGYLGSQGSQPILQVAAAVLSGFISRTGNLTSFSADLDLRLIPASALILLALEIHLIGKPGLGCQR